MIRDAHEEIGRWRRQRARAGAMLVALDFDGTLAPIVEHPAEAALPPATRRALARLAARTDTRVAIISGRALADVRAKVGMDGLHYAGNHGLEIDGPGVSRVHPIAGDAARALRGCLELLRAELDSIDGVIVEDKGLTLTVHYRMAPDARARVERAAARCADMGTLRVTPGRMIVEVRPDIDWDKGRALSFLVDALLPSNADAPVIFVGDDRTDEDAFRALAGRGDGILVGHPPRAGTAATFHLRSPEEMPSLLEALAVDEATGSI